MSKITVNNVELPVVEYRGQRVVTLAMIDQAHERPDDTARRTFTSHRSRLVEGEDFYLVDFAQKDVLRPFGIDVPPRGLTVLTESGYLMLVKPFTDDLSWDVQRKLVKSYFRLPESDAPKADPMEVLNDPAAMRGLLLNYSEKVLALEATVQEQAPKVEVHDRIADAAGSLSLRETATTIGYPERKMILWMQQKDWLYRRAGHKNLLGYADKIKAGYLVHKVTPIVDAHTGEEKISEQVRVTPMGLTVLARRLALPKLEVPAGLLGVRSVDRGNARL